MSEVQSEAAAKKRNPLRMVLGGVILVGVAAVLYVIATASFKPSGPADLTEFKKGTLEKLDVPAAPRAAPDTVFTSLDGKPATLADFKGRVVVMNLWATWCAPCVRALPEIEHFLKSQPGWQGLGLAIDRKEAVQEFLGRLPLSLPLALGGVQGLELGRQLGNSQGGLPFSVVFDAAGQLFWRRLGALQAGELEAVAQALASGRPAPEAGKTGA